MSASTAPASSSGLYADPREDWLAQHNEEAIDPGRPIVDPHHHLWDRGGLRYMIEEMAADIASGHNIVATLYVDCRSMYRAGGPEAFRPVGEVEDDFEEGFELLALGDERYEEMVAKRRRTDRLIDLRVCGTRREAMIREGLRKRPADM